MKFKLNENLFLNILTWVLLLMGTCLIIWSDDNTYGIILIAIGLALTVIPTVNKKDKN